MNIDYIQLPSPLFGFKQLFEASKIVDNAFAAGYFNNHLKEIECGFVALDGDKVIGWAAVSVKTNESNSSEGLLRCIAVHPNYRGQGVGKRLTEKRLKYLDYCSSVWSYAWVRPNGNCMSCKNLENFGFKIHKELDDYYTTTRAKCKYCGKKCTCKAVLYVRRNC